MTDLSCINAGIVAMLAEAFPNIPIIAETIREGITRPSFKVNFGEIVISADSIEYWQRKIPVEIAYFAENTNDPKPECYRRQRQLTALLLGAEITATIAQNRLAQKRIPLQSGEITVLGNWRAEIGKTIAVNDSATGLSGDYIIDTVVHDVSDGLHLMTLGFTQRGGGA